MAAMASVTPLTATRLRPTGAVRLDPRWTLVLMATPLLGATLLAKLALPPLGAMGIAIGMFLNLLAGAWGLASGRLLLDARVLAGFAILFAFAGIGPMLRGEAYSLPSLVFLMVLHAPYVLVAAAGKAVDVQAMQRLFSQLCLFVAWCGIVQFGIQFVIGPVLAFPVENLVPEALQVQAFNKQGPLAYGYDIYRSNGVFLLEPSFFSQFMAIGIAFELAVTRAWWRAALMAVALVLSYSGTGIIVLAVCLPVVAVAYQRWQLVPLAVLAGVLVLVGADYLNLDLFVSRAGEFQSTGSSAFARFVGGFYLFEQFLWDEPLRALFGYGAGTFKDYAPQVSVPVAEMAVPKMVFEFGLLGGLLYFGLLAWVVFRSPAPFILRLAVYVTYFLSGNYIVFSHGLALSLLAWPNDLRALPSPRGPAR